MKIFTDNLENEKEINIREIETDTCFGEYHFHSQYEIICCFSGTAKISMPFGSTELHPGECLIILPYNIHTMDFFNFKGVKLAFKRHIIGKYFHPSVASDLLLEQTKNAIYKTDEVNCINAIFSIIENANDENYGLSFFYIAKTLLIFKNCKNIICYSEQQNQLFYRIIKFIDENISKDLSLHQLSESFQVTENHICRLFKNEISMSPTTYITNIRMTKACKLLAETNTEIKKISKICGFKSHTYFHNVFKSNFNITPNVYRSKNKL